MCDCEIDKRKWHNFDDVRVPVLEADWRPSGAGSTMEDIAVSDLAVAGEAVERSTNIMIDASGAFSSMFSGISCIGYTRRYKQKYFVTHQPRRAAGRATMAAIDRKAHAMNASTPPTRPPLLAAT
jgi:hypothetical protein